MRARKTANRQIEAIVFDIGRVIVKLDPMRAFAHIARMSGARNGNARKSSTDRQNTVQSSLAAGRDLYLAIQRDPLWNDWQEGRVAPSNWYRNLCKRFNVKASYKDFREAWNSTIVSEPDLLLPASLFARLRARHRLVLLSNTDPLHVQHMQANFEFMRHFDEGVYSCEVGASKPSRAIFRAAIRAARTTPDRILFIDDIKDYISAARGIGLNAVHFRNRPQLLRELRRRKIL